MILGDKKFNGGNIGSIRIWRYVMDLRNVKKILYKQTQKMRFLYVFILTLHVSNDHFVHHQEFMIYCILQLCTKHANVSYGRNQFQP